MAILPRAWQTPSAQPTTQTPTAQPVAPAPTAAPTSPTATPAQPTYAAPTAAAPAGTTWDQAWQQYQDAYRQAGAGDLLEGDYAAEAQREFGDYWKNASLDSGMMQGDAYQRSWTDIMPDLQAAIQRRIAERTPGVVQPDSNAPAAPAPQPTAVQSWTGSAAAGPAPSMPVPTAPSAASSSWQESGYIDPDIMAKRNALYDQLMSRATQGLNVQRTDPAVRAQADAYAANEERARRNYISDVAEGMGPYANIRGEQRMAAERMGQRTGAFEAELMGREIAARRAEISEALQLMGGYLSDDQRLALQRELAQWDDAYRYANMAMQNDQFGRQLGFNYAGLNSENDRFANQLGFNYADRANYYDLIRRGLMG